MAHEVFAKAKDHIFGDVVNAMAEKRSEILSASAGPVVAVMTPWFSQGEWTYVKGKKNNIHKNGSPKSNPFMVYNDFTFESRFLINRTNEFSPKKSVSSIAQDGRNRGDVAKNITRCRAR